MAASAAPGFGAALRAAALRAAGAASGLAAADAARGGGGRGRGAPAATAAPAFPLRGGWEVRLVQVLHRHGARTAFASLPGVPELAPGSPAWDAAWGQCRQPLSREERARGGAISAYGPCARGQLTRHGEAQLEELGAFLRREYVEAAGRSGGALVSPRFPTRGEFRVASTKTSRTIFSAWALLRGLFPQASEDTLRELIEVRDDGLICCDHEQCDRLRQLFHEERPRVDATLLCAAARLRLNAAIGQQESELLTLIAAGDALRSLQAQGLPLPFGFSPDFAADVDAAGHEYVDVLLGRHSPELRRLSSGLLVAELRDQVTAAASGRSPLRLSVLSGHDISIGGLLAALGLPSHRWPGFASSVFLELLRERATGEFQVRVVCYDGPPSAGEGAADNKMLDITVPFEAWEDAVAPLALSQDEYLRACRLPSGTPKPPPHYW